MTSTTDNEKPLSKELAASEYASSEELTAAAALAWLVSAPTAAPASRKEGTEAADNDSKDEHASSFVIPQRLTKSGRQRAIPFPFKLMKVLSDSKYSHIISWMPSGKSFMIHKPKLFAAQVLPLEFKQAKHSSFTRKLHRWGFMRHCRGDEAGAFFHEKFQKSRLDLADEMTCYSGKDHKQELSLDTRTTTMVKPTAVRPLNVAGHSMPQPQVAPSPALIPQQEPRLVLNSLEGLNAPSRSGPPTVSNTPATSTMESSLAANLRQVDNNTLLTLQRQQQQQQSIEGAPHLNGMIQMEMLRRLLQDRIEQANNANPLALLHQQHREAQLQAEQQQRREAQLQAQQDQREANLKALTQQVQLPPAPFVSAWQQPTSNLSINRTLLALAAQNLAMGGGDKSIKLQNQICYTTMRPSLPRTNIEGAKTA